MTSTNRVPAVIRVRGARNPAVPYSIAGAAGDAERWFATTLAPVAVGETLADHPDGVPADAFETILRADHDLPVGAVGLRAVHPAFLGRLDDVAHWALTRCLVAELLAETVLAP